MKHNIIDLIKKNYVILSLLVLILFLGLYLRIYNLDFPSIGYHNMKENEYLCEAKYYYDTNSDLLRRVLCIFGMYDGPGYFEEYPQMPILPWAIYLMWKIFGMHFWAARIIIILFSLSTIVLMYLIAKQLTNNRYISLLSSFLIAIMPLNVFFGRNIQPETPALAFLMFAIYFYLKWTNDFKIRQLLLCSIGLMFTALFKYTFLIGAIPLLFITPYKEIMLHLKSAEKRNDLVKQALFSAIPLTIPFIWIWITNNFLNVLEKGDVLGGTFSRISLFRVFTSGYWNEFWPAFSGYFKDNWTWWFFWFAILGGLLLLLKYKSKVSKFVLGYFIALIPYSMILSDYIKAHSYYQMPFVPLVCISSAYLIYTIGSVLNQIIKIKHLAYISLALLIPAIPDVQDSTDRQYSTIFYGLDVAGQYIQENSNPYDRFFIFGHSQTVGVCFNSDRRCGGVVNLSDFKRGEQDLNFSWVFIHGDYGMYELQKQNATWEYVQNNYKVAQIGFFKTEKGAAVQYYILKKGGKLNLTEIAAKPIKIGKTYKTKHGDITLYTVSND